MDNKPDESSPSLEELFESADVFTQKAYSSALSTCVLLQRALKASPEAIRLRPRYYCID